MAFNADVFKSLFQTDEDWQGFFKMVFFDQMEKLKKHKPLEIEPSEGLDLIFRRMADARYEAQGEAYKKWVKSADYKAYSQELVDRAMHEVSEYDRWLARKYTDRKLIHDSMEYGEFTKPVPTIGGEEKWVNDDVEAIA